MQWVRYWCTLVTGWWLGAWWTLTATFSSSAGGRGQTARLPQAMQLRTMHEQLSGTRVFRSAAQHAPEMQCAGSRSCLTSLLACMRDLLLYCCEKRGRTLQFATVQVRPELVPAHISPATAEAVLFVGKAARVLLGTACSAAASGSSRGDSSLSAQLSTQASVDGLTASGSAAGGRAGEAANSCNPETDAASTAQRLQQLAAQQQFDPLALAACVDASHKQASCSFFKRQLAPAVEHSMHPMCQNLLNISGTQAAAALWRLLVGRTRLGDHLAALRKYFLLGAGDFWHAFLMQVVTRAPIGDGAPGMGVEASCHQWSANHATHCKTSFEWEAAGTQAFQTSS